MWHLYLDESGDLGFDFTTRASKFLTICVLATSQIQTVQKIQTAVRRTLRKINRRKGQLRELKGTKTDIKTKRFFYRRMSACRFGIYAVTLNKQRVYEQLRRSPQKRERLYNFIAKKVLERIPFEMSKGGVELIVDKSKGKWEIADFNRYVLTHLQGRIDPDCPVNIVHRDSCEDTGLSAVDLFCWGVFRKHERNDTEWYGDYRDKIVLDDTYL